MKNIANKIKDYSYGFAHGFGQISLALPYAYSTFSRKSKEKDHEKESKYIEIGFNHGINLGFASCAIQLIIYTNLLSNGHPEIIALPGGTNTLSYLYENFRYLYKKN